MNYRKPLRRVAMLLVLREPGSWHLRAKPHSPTRSAPLPTRRNPATLGDPFNTNWKPRQPTIRTGAIAFTAKMKRDRQDRDVIDTKDGQIARTLLINGQPLTAEQRAAR